MNQDWTVLFVEGAEEILAAVLLFPHVTIRKSHHHDFPISWIGTQSQIVETVSHSSTTGQKRIRVQNTPLIILICICMYLFIYTYIIHKHIYIYIYIYTDLQIVQHIIIGISHPKLPVILVWLVVFVWLCILQKKPWINCTCIISLNRLELNKLNILENIFPNSQKPHMSLKMTGYHQKMFFHILQFTQITFRNHFTNILRHK